MTLLRMLKIGLVLVVALHYTLPASATRSHVILPATDDHGHHDHRHHDHGHSHDAETPEHDHGSFGRAFQMWTVPSRTALASAVHIMSVPAVVVETHALVCNLPAASVPQPAPIRLDPPPERSLTVLLI